MIKIINLLIRITLVLAVPIFVAVGTYFYLSDHFLSPVTPGSGETVLVEVEPGSSFDKITRLIAEKGLVRTPWALKVMARLKKIDKSVNAGEYELSPGMNPVEILEKLVSGDVYQRVVTVREGQSIWNIGAIVAAAGLIEEKDFNKVLSDPSLLAAAGIQAKTFEGYLFPETYSFSRPISARKIVWKMLEQGDKNWPKAYADRAFDLGYTRHEILTLASIIEKESGNVEEQPLISSVFHNRLNQGMRLQADPTVIYGVKNFDGNLTKKHLLTPTPYNTYTNFGLPPGPIANPGASAIKAALFPVDSTYLFFVADKKGGHVFSSTLRDHNNNVRKYQLSKRAAPAAKKKELDTVAPPETDTNGEPVKQAPAKAPEAPGPKQ